MRPEDRPAQANAQTDVVEIIRRFQMKMLFRSLPVFLLLAASAVASVLSDTAAQMAPGTWREIFTSNVDPILSENTSSTMIPYTDDIKYGHAEERFYYIGADHCKYAQFISYDEGANAWENLPRASWMPPSSAYCNGMMHGYDHGAMDPSRGYYYHRNGKLLQRYNIATGTWNQTPAWAFGDYSNCCDAVEYFPELDGVVYVNGNNGFPGAVYLYKESTNQWTRLAGDLNPGSTYQYAEYNPVHKVLVFVIQGVHYKLDSSGQVTPLSAPPVGLYNGSGYVGVLTVDPVSGDYLVLTPVDRQFYTYNVLTDTWQLQSSPTKPNMNNHAVVACPVSDYGVNFFTACRSSGCHVYLYKHSAGTGGENPAGLYGNVSVLAAAPNPFSSRVTIQLMTAPQASFRIGIYNLRGRRLADLTPQLSAGTRAVWEPEGLPPGLYALRLETANRTFVKKLVLLR
jgi:hypothetical protein